MRSPVRKAVVGDGPGIARVHIETWQRAYRGLLPDDFLDRMSADLVRRSVWWDQQIADAELHRTTQLVAEDDRGIVGFVTCGPDDDQGGAGEIYAIYVHPRGWDKGYGRELFAAGVSALTAAGYRQAILWVLETNARARRFYELAGWRADGGRKTERRNDVVLEEIRYRSPALG